jgi:hypothetical protein
MNDTERVEQARAEREARDATVHRTSRGPVSEAVQAALSTYLAAEQYHERDPDRRGEPAAETGTDDASDEQRVGPADDVR